MPLLLVLFYCSGACGLAYQVLWMRQLSYVFGVTAYAVGTVLAAFMAGLAVGSWLAGPLLDRVKRPLVALAAAEMLIGLSAVATPAALNLASSVYRALYATAPDAFVLQTVARFMCAFVVLILPTMLMGLTLPLVSASSVVRGAQAPARVGALYAVNTAGAVSGALLTGYVLIGAVGMRRTFLLAAALNTIVGLSALALDWWLGHPAADAGRLQPDASATRELRLPSALGPRPAPSLVWIVMAVSGFGALALEVVWFRLMTQYVDATTYAFTSMLAVVLTGIALGGAAASRLLTRDRDWYLWLAAIQLATGVAAVVGLGLIGWDEVLGIRAPRPGRRVMLAVLLPSLLMGFSFPVLLKLGVPGRVDHDADGSVRGRMVGRFYGVNVLGAILGSLAGGFLILPALGTRAALIALAGLFVVTGLAVSAVYLRRARAMILGAVGTAAFTALAVGVPDPFVVAMRLRDDASSVEIFRAEGVQTTVSVHTSGLERTLLVGGLHQANDSEAMVALHRRIGLLPMALHPSPQSALVIGLGGGATAGAVSQHAGTSVQIVELSDGVRQAAALFSHVTYDVLNQPNVRVRVDDGRNFLMLSGERFDVITADIVQPIHAGAGGLYSREYFQLVRHALEPGGLALQWIGDREKSHYQLIMRTFLDVFPNATLWLGGQLMVGSAEPLKLDPAAFDAKLAHPQTREALAAAGLGSYDALRQAYTAGPRAMDEFVGSGPLLTDDLPLVEYHRSLAPDRERLDLSRFTGTVADIEK